MAGLQSPQDDFGQKKRDAATPGKPTEQAWQQPQPDAQHEDAQPQDAQQDTQPQDGQSQYAQPQNGQPQYAQQSDGQSQYGQVQAYAPQQPPAGARRQYATGLTSAQEVWYILQCIYFGMGYFAKIPAKKALEDYGMAQLTSTEQFWYTVQCIFLGAGYFAKIPTAKALSEMPQFKTAGYRR
jgi:hypothetical protein